MTPHNVELLLVDLALIIVLARLLGLAARRLGQPQVLGEIVAGILLGPTLFSGAITDTLFPVDLLPSLSALANVGLVLFMFIIGYELDRDLIRGRERIAATVSLGSILVPMLAGFGLGLWLGTKHDHAGSLTSFALFVGASMSVTAFPVLARILTDRGLHRTRIGGLAVASAAVDDVAAWTILAVVVTIAGAAAGDTWHILFAPLYLALMYGAVRPLLRWVSERQRRENRLTPDLLAVVLIGLLLSAYATQWLGVHFIFGAFIFGTVMPRKDGAVLRERILERLEQISVLLLLPVFFIIAGLSVNLSAIGGQGLVELLAILGVAIGGKFVGAYIGATVQGVSRRHSAVLATLMNTRGLTEIVILSVGKELGVLDDSLFSLLVLMALITTAMTGPLLRLVYPPRLAERDLADARRAALGTTTAYRVLVVPESGTDTALVDVGLDLAAARRPAQLVLSRLVPQKSVERLEVGSGLGLGLMVMTRTMSELHALARRGEARGIDVSVYSQFSDDLAKDLTQHIIDVAPDLVVLPASAQLAPHDFLPRTVVRRAELPLEVASVAVLRNGAGADVQVALQVAVQIALGRQVALVFVGGGSRRDRAVLAGLERHNISASVGELPPRSIVVGTERDQNAHLVARARSDDEVDDVDEWVSLVSAERQS
ncbi:MAG TPA: cation:proton antiporter [Jatrophihabitans sp.]|nr:cation:proton antiporter [Jatrophihabitans sp.]